MIENYEIWVAGGLYLLHRVFLMLGWRKKTSASSEPPVSILIPAHNAASQLKRLLPQIFQQTYSAPWEICLIDDRSTDETFIFLQELAYPSHFQTIKISSLPPNCNPKKHALMMGLQKARYEWILFLDADIHLPPGQNWLRDFMRQAGNLEALIGISWLTADKSLPQKFWAAEGNFLLWQAIGWASWGIPYLSVGRTWACKKSHALQAIARYATLWSGDDDLTLQSLDPSQVGIAFTQTTLSPAPTGWVKGILRKWRHQQTAKFYKPYLWLLLGFPSMCLGILYLAALRETATLLIVVILTGISSLIVTRNAPSKMITLWIHQLLQPLLEAGWVILSFIPRRKW